MGKLDRTKNFGVGLIIAYDILCDCTIAALYFGWWRLRWMTKFPHEYMRIRFILPWHMDTRG